MRTLMRVFALLVIAVAVLPLLPAAAQSSCTISTPFNNIRMRAGHSTDDRVIALLRPNTSYDVTEVFYETRPSGAVRTWYHLAPGSASEDVWVGGSVVPTGNCVSITAAVPVASTTTTTTTSDPAAAPTTAAPVTSGVILPQSGTWTWTLGGTMTVSCPGIGSITVPTSEIGIGSSFEVTVASSATNFSVDGVAYTQDASGTWNGFYSEAGSAGQAKLRINTPTSLLGDLVITLTDGSGCSGTVPLSGVPRV